MKFRILFALAGLLLGHVFGFAQTLPDQVVASYGDNATPYPLYCGIWGEEPAYTDAELEFLATHFDALYGAFEINRAQAGRIRAINPDFQIVSYNGAWRTSSLDIPEEVIERDHKHNILHYRVGDLAEGVGAADTEILLKNLHGALIPSTAAPGRTVSYREEGRWRYPTWLVIDGERMRIEAVDGARVRVTRGWDGTQAAAHAKDAPAVTPVYSRPPSSRHGVSYRNDAGAPIRWQTHARRLEEAYTEHGGGIWIDIVMGGFAQETMTGERVRPDRLWDVRNNVPYTGSSYAREVEKAIHGLQTGFRARHGQWPVLWANNLMQPTDASDDRLKLLLVSDVKPRPLDGFAMENSYAHYGYGGGSGKEFFWRNYDEWQETLESIMLMGELKVSARPLVMDGGIDNNKFTALPAAERHRILLYSYASYLLAVKVEPDDRIYTMLGLTAKVVTAEGPTLRIDPCFTWDIGRPTETRAHEDYSGYKLPDRKVFMRRFENGIVLVNPSDVEEGSIDLRDLGGPFINPDQSGNLVADLSLGARTGVILLNPGT